MGNISTINFHGDALSVIERDDGRYVAMRPIVEAMGMGWGSQRQKIIGDPVLGSTVTTVVTVGSDGKPRDMTCLPLNKLNGWLFRIDSRRVRANHSTVTAV